MSPRITAPTVAEHRARQRAALLNAARAILLEDGAAAVTPAAVGAAAGIARSSVYEYFPTVADLLAEIAVDAFARWGQTIGTALATVDDGWPLVEAYVRATLDLVARGEHRIAQALGTVSLPPTCREQLRRLHDDLQAPLLHALRAMGTACPDRMAALVQGVVDAASRCIERGDDPAAVTDEAIAFIRTGLR